MTQPQQEYIITDNQLDILERVSVSGYSNVFRNIRSRRHTPAPANTIPLCLCKSCAYTNRCGFEVAKIREENTPTCDDDCTHGRWYIGNTGKLLCDRICIHTVDNFVCPFEHHDDATINEFYKRIKAERDPSLEYVDWDSIEAFFIRLRDGVK